MPPSDATVQKIYDKLGSIENTLTAFIARSEACSQRCHQTYDAVFCGDEENPSIVSKASMGWKAYAAVFGNGSLGLKTKITVLWGTVIAMLMMVGYWVVPKIGNSLFSG